MFRATAGKILPTTITGSLPRPSWYTENLGTRAFLDAMVLSRFREQYVDTLSVYLREQEVAGLDIVTDGDCRFDQDIGGVRPEDHQCADRALQTRGEVPRSLCPDRAWRPAPQATPGPAFPAS